MGFKISMTAALNKKWISLQFMWRALSLPDVSDKQQQSSAPTERSHNTNQIL